MLLGLAGGAGRMRTDERLTVRVRSTVPPRTTCARPLLPSCPSTLGSRRRVLVAPLPLRPCPSPLRLGQPRKLGLHARRRPSIPAPRQQSLSVDRGAHPASVLQPGRPIHRARLTTNHHHLDRHEHIHPASRVIPPLGGAGRRSRDCVARGTSAAISSRRCELTNDRR